MKFTKEITKETNTRLGMFFIRKYSPVTVLEHWLFSITTLVLIITGMPFAFFWLFDLFSIFPLVKIDNKILALFLNIHPYFGFFFTAICIVHILVHFSNIRSNEFWFLNSSENRLFSRDFRALMHSLSYLLGFSNRVEHTSEKFNGYSRANYLSLLFAIVPIIVSSFVFQLVFQLRNLPINLLLSNNFCFYLAYVVHILFGTFLFLIVTYHILHKLRAFDAVPFASIFLGKEIPYWYARKYHKTWFKECLKTWLDKKDDEKENVKEKDVKEKEKGDENLQSVIYSILRSIYPEFSDESLKEIACILSKDVNKDKDDDKDANKDIDKDEELEIKMKLKQLETILGGNA